MEVREKHVKGKKSSFDEPPLYVGRSYGEKLLGRSHGEKLLGRSCLVSAVGEELLGRSCWGEAVGEELLGRSR